MKRKSKSSFRNKVSKDTQRQKVAESSYGYLSLPKNVRILSIDPGSRVSLDFLPYTVSDKKHPDRDQKDDIAMPRTLWYKRPFKIHRNIGSSSETIVCLTSFGKPCPICEYRIKKNKEGAEKEELDLLKNSLRNLYIVIPKGSKKFEEVPYVFDISQYCFQNLLNDELEENDEYEIFPDIEEGYTLKIRFDKKTVGAGNPFATASRIDFLEREEQYDDSILEEVPDLDSLLKRYTYDQLEALFFETDKDIENEDEDEDENNKSRRKSSKTKIEEKNNSTNYNWKDLKEITQSKLENVIEEMGLEIDPANYEDDITALRREIAKELGIEIPERRTTKGTNSTTIKKKNKCIYDHKFGKDAEEYDDCDDCDILEDCIKESEK